MIVQSGSAKTSTTMTSDKLPLENVSHAQSLYGRTDVQTSRASKMPIDQPPAYSDMTRPIEYQPVSPRNVVEHSHYYDSSPAVRYPPPTVDQVHIFERKHPIKGTFYIDPQVPAIDRQKTKRKKSKKPLPHASFRSRNGEINLELATTGDFRASPKADVAVSSRSGHIKVNLLPMPPSRPRIGLDVESRNGNVSLFIPEGFIGVVHLTTRSGELVIMPALLACIQTVKSTARETIFMVGTGHHNGSDKNQEASFCGVQTRNGNIIVGLSGQDHVVSPTSIWKRLGSFLKGTGCSNADEDSSPEH